jgi:hypothetical protein
MQIMPARFLLLHGQIPAVLTSRLAHQSFFFSDMGRSADTGRGPSSSLRRGVMSLTALWLHVGCQSLAISMNQSEKKGFPEPVRFQ